METEPHSAAKNHTKGRAVRIFLTGATGHIGSGVLSALLSAGHTVTALVRTTAAAETVAREGVETVVGDMRDGATVRRLAAEIDAVIHTALPGDETSPAAEAEFSDAVIAGLDGQGGTFIRTGGVWVHGSSAAVSEETPHDPPAIVAWRPALDQRILSAPGIRSVLIEPGIVYGQGRGIPNVVIGAAQTDIEPSALTLVGAGTQHWTTIHVDDLADLYVRALEKADHGATFLGVSGDNPTVQQLGEAASRRLGLGGRVVPESAAETVDRLGAFGEALLLDQQSSGDHARNLLGWRPTRRSLVAEIEAGGYDPQ